jgi:hypothetical protein
MFALFRPLALAFALVALAAATSPVLAQPRVNAVESFVFNEFDGGL